MSKNLLMGRQCIYCLKYKAYDPDNSSTSEFNGEHVVQKAFTKGFSGNLIVHGRVCTECNSYFDRHLDVVLTRQSLAALQRYPTGLKPISELVDFKGKNVKCNSESENYIYAGAPMKPAAADGSLSYEYVPHLAVESDGEIVRVLLQDLQDPNFNLPQFNEQPRVTLVESNDEDKRLLQTALADRKISLLDTTEISAGNIDVFAEEVLDEVALRGIAKIAFNYVSYTTQDAEPSLIFEKHFDQYRNFIRHGVTPRLIPRLLSVSHPSQHNFAHLVQLKSCVRYGKAQLFGLVRLFGIALVEVPLGNDFELSRQLPDSGHSWQMANKICRPVC